VWITSNSHTNEAEACPFWVLPYVNDASGAFFVHLVYSFAVSIRKPMLFAVEQNPRTGAEIDRPRFPVTAGEGLLPR
jgi:hypothetical protein